MKATISFHGGISFICCDCACLLLNGDGGVLHHPGTFLDEEAFADGGIKAVPSKCPQAGKWFKSPFYTVQLEEIKT